MKKIIFLFILLPALSYSQVLMQGGIKADTAEVIATKTTAKNGGLYMGSGKTPSSDTVEVLIDKGLTFSTTSINAPAGSSVNIGFSSAPEIGVFSGYCITAGAVKVRYYNPTAAAIDPTSKTYYLYLVSPN